IVSYANEVQLSAKQPMKVKFRIAHQNKNGQPVFEGIQSIELNNNSVTIPTPLNNYELSGLIIVSVNGHELPPTANQFNKPEQCSMTTNKIHPHGDLEFTATNHSLNCKAKGGIFY